MHEIDCSWTQIRYLQMHEHFVTDFVEVLVDLLQYLLLFCDSEIFHFYFEGFETSSVGARRPHFQNLEPLRQRIGKRISSSVFTWQLDQKDDFIL
jgi:hypothetical protein